MLISQKEQMSRGVISRGPTGTAFLPGLAFLESPFVNFVISISLESLFHIDVVIH